MGPWINLLGKRWVALCQRTGGAHKHTEMLRGIVEENVAGRQASVWVWVCVQPCSLALCTTPLCLHTHCVCLCWRWYRWLLRTGRTTTGSSPLAARGESKDRRGERAREEGEGVDEVSKDSCIVELYLLHSTIWTVSTLHFNKSSEVK